MMLLYSIALLICVAIFGLLIFRINFRLFFWWEVCTVLIPGLWHALLFHRLGTGKSISNLVEAILVALCFSAWLIVRNKIWSDFQQRLVLAILTPLIGVAMSTLIYFLTPSLPE